MWINSWDKIWDVEEYRRLLNAFKEREYASTPTHCVAINPGAFVGAFSVQREYRHSIRWEKEAKWVLIVCLFIGGLWGCYRMIVGRIWI